MTARSIDDALAASERATVPAPVGDDTPPTIRYARTSSGTLVIPVPAGEYHPAGPDATTVRPPAMPGA